MKGRTIFAKPFLKGEELRSHKEEVGKRRVFIVGLPYTFTDQDLRSLLEPFGPLEEAFIAKDHDLDNKSRGFGYATFKRLQDANRALELGVIFTQGVKIEIVPFQKREASDEFSFNQKPDIQRLEQGRSTKNPNSPQNNYFSEKNNFSKTTQLLTKKEVLYQNHREEIHNSSIKHYERPIRSDREKNNKLEGNQIFLREIGPESLEQEQEGHLMRHLSHQNEGSYESSNKDFGCSRIHQEEPCYRYYPQKLSYAALLAGENGNIEEEDRWRGVKKSNFGYTEHFQNKNPRKIFILNQHLHYSEQIEQNFSQNHEKFASKNSQENQNFDSAEGGYGGRRSDRQSISINNRLNHYQQIQKNGRERLRGSRDFDIEENYRSRLPSYEGVDTTYRATRSQNHKNLRLRFQKNTIVMNDDNGYRGVCPRYLDLNQHSGAFQDYEDDYHPRYRIEEYDSEYYDQINNRANFQRNRENFDYYHHNHAEFSPEPQEEQEGRPYGVLDYSLHQISRNNHLNHGCCWNQERRRRSEPPFTNQDFPKQKNSFCPFSHFQSNLRFNKARSPPRRRHEGSLSPTPNLLRSLSSRE